MLDHTIPSEVRLPCTSRHGSSRNFSSRFSSLAYQALTYGRVSRKLSFPDCI
jgi:hypothetical protein